MPAAARRDVHSTAEAPGAAAARTAVLKARVGNAQGSAEQAGKEKMQPNEGPERGSNKHAHNGATEVKQRLKEQRGSAAMVGR